MASLLAPLWRKKNPITAIEFATCDKSKTIDIYSQNTEEAITKGSCGVVINVLGIDTTLNLNPQLQSNKHTEHWY